MSIIWKLVRNANSWALPQPNTLSHFSVGRILMWLKSEAVILKLYLLPLNPHLSPCFCSGHQAWPRWPIKTETLGSTREFLMTSCCCLLYSLTLSPWVYLTVCQSSYWYVKCYRNNCEAWNENTLLQRVFAFASARHLGTHPVCTTLLKVWHFLDNPRDPLFFNSL